MFGMLTKTLSISLGYISYNSGGNPLSHFELLKAHVATFIPVLSFWDSGQIFNEFLST